MLSAVFDVNGSRDSHGALLFPGSAICRSLTREEWESSPAYTLHRGLTSAATSIPLWFLQSANQRIDKWPRIGEYRPIFTQHLEGQFRWMELVSLPEDWFERYAAKSGVRLHRERLLVVG